MPSSRPSKPKSLFNHLWCDLFIMIVHILDNAGYGAHHKNQQQNGIQVFLAFFLLYPVNQLKKRFQSIAGSFLCRLGNKGRMIALLHKNRLVEICQTMIKNVFPILF